MRGVAGEAIWVGSDGVVWVDWGEGGDLGGREGCRVGRLGAV